MKNSYYRTLFEKLPPGPSSALGSKPLNLEARRLEAKRLSNLMTKKRPFSFLRLGDMDLAYLLAAQNNESTGFEIDDGPVSSLTPYGNPGIGGNYIGRLQEAFLKSDYVDFHERLYPMEYWLPHLDLSRPAHLHRNPDRETSYLSLTWLEFEFKNYCQGHRIGIVGAEARLLDLLTQEPTWQAAAKPWWPDQAKVFFHQVRDDGRNLNRNLDLIKQDLTDFILRNQIDTLFISLGGGAKILCYELAQEFNICTFDFGSMIRALTYSACDGNRAARSTHSPFLFRIPFHVFMNALEQAFPRLTKEELFVKAHAQLLLEIQQKECGWTHTAWEYDFCDENKYNFHEGYRSYVRQYRYLKKISLTTHKEYRSFLYFCGCHHLTLEGRIFFSMQLLKSAIKSKTLTIIPRSALKFVTRKFFNRQSQITDS